MKSGEVTPAVFTDYSKAFASTDFDINVSCRILSFLLIFRIVAQIFLICHASWKQDRTVLMYASKVKTKLLK